MTTDANVNIVIYDVNGKRVEQLVDNYLTKGLHKVKWNSRAVRQGVYLANILVKDQSYSQVIVVME